MKTYCVQYDIVSSYRVKIDAKSEEEAKNETKYKIENNELPSLTSKIIFSEATVSDVFELDNF